MKALMEAQRQRQIVVEHQRRARADDLDADGAIKYSMADEELLEAERSQLDRLVETLWLERLVAA